MRISVFGLGYVGAVSGVCLASLGHEIIGVDTNEEKVKALNGGESPVTEKGLSTLLANEQVSSRIRATINGAEAVSLTDVSLVCVGTPSDTSGALDLRFVKRVCYDIGKALRDKSKYHLIVVRSTILPGTTEKYLIPLLEEYSGRKAGSDFGICYNPEFLREGSSIYDFFHPPYIVIGEYDSRSALITSDIYKDFDTGFQVVPIKVAEMIKFACNAFHALKITFANEMGNICKQENIDSRLLMEVFCMDRKLNLSPYYLKPGFAFGGSCLVKDLQALLKHCHGSKVECPMLAAILPSNDHQLKIGYKMVIKEGRDKSIGLLGLSFKPGTDDLRNSPFVFLTKKLINNGCNVQIYDKMVSLSRLHGVNRDFLNREIPRIGEMMVDRIDEIVESCDVIIVSHNTREFRDVLKRLRPNQKIIDLAHLTLEPKQKLSPDYQGICW